MSRARLEALILSVLEHSTSLCMDSEENRAALADVLTVDIAGAFHVIEKLKPVTTLGELPALPAGYVVDLAFPAYEKSDGKIHEPADCTGEFCCFHNPSAHHMVEWKKEIRFDRSNMVERICPHGIGHPDPDSLAWMQRVGIEDDGTHGCDGCCQPPK